MTMRARFLMAKQSAQGDEGFALIYAILMIVVITLLSTAVLALVVQQVKPTQFQKKREQTLNTAEAGLESTLNRLRNSTTTTSTGVLGNVGLLPMCGGNTYATLTGSVDATTVNTYVSKIYYLSGNPSGLTFGGTSFNALVMPCSPLQAQPRYAYVVSAGSGVALAGQAATAGNRTLHATYQFVTLNNQVTGGRVWPFTDTTGTNGTGTPITCWDTGTMTPMAGSTYLTLQNCGGANTVNTSNVQQSFTYEPNLSLQWTGNNSVTPALCLTRDTTSLPKLAVCSGVTTTYPYANTAAGQAPVAGTPGDLQERQEWGVNGNGNIEGVSNSGLVSGNCYVASGSFAAGTQMILGGCGGVNSAQAYSSDPQVGAGAAIDTSGFPSAKTLQLANYQEPGRCLDITSQDPSQPSEIDYPCKEQPIGIGDPSRADWNQEWTYTADSSGSLTGTLSTLRPADGLYYCLDSNLQPGQYVRAFLCNLGGSNAGQSTAVGSSNAAASQQWTFTGNLGPANYTTSFNITNNNLCLSIETLNPSPYGYSTPFMETCNGSDRQKWNAPAGPTTTKLGDVAEQQH